MQQAATHADEYVTHPVEVVEYITTQFIAGSMKNSLNLISSGCDLLSGSLLCVDKIDLRRGDNAVVSTQGVTVFGTRLLDEDVFEVGHYLSVGASEGK